VRAGVASRIVATGVPAAAGVARQVTERLDRYAGALAAARVDACEATYVRGARTAALYDERFACFDRRGEDLWATVRLFDRIPDGQLAALAHATGALPELASCSDDAYLRDSALPADRAARDQVLALQKLAAAARAFDRGAQFPAALDVARRLIASPAAAAFRPLLAEARQAEGHALEHLGDPRAAEAALLTAIADADASRADRIRAQAMADLAVVYLDLERPDDAERVLGALEAVAARVGSSTLEAGRLSALSRVASARGDHAAAADHARRALETWQTTGDPDPDTLSDLHAAVGQALAADLAALRFDLERARKR
jgi:tetratricopeptide (TPR) repeat protein